MVTPVVDEAVHQDCHHYLPVGTSSKSLRRSVVNLLITRRQRTAVKARVITSGCPLSHVIRGSRAKVSSMPTGTILLGFPLKRRRSLIGELPGEKKSGTLRHRSPAMKRTTAMRNWLGARATARPRLEELPLPPKNLRKVGQHCPARAATPAIRIRLRLRPRLYPIKAGTIPLVKLPNPATIPSSAPVACHRLLPLILLLPCSRRLIPRSRAVAQTKGIEPLKIGTQNQASPSPDISCQHRKKALSRQARSALRQPEPSH